MTDLKKIIDKAVSGGYQYELTGFNYHEDCPDWEDGYNLDGFLLSHDFLKAFFGEKELHSEPFNDDIDQDFTSIEKWKWHAKQLVLSEDRISYLLNYMEV